MGRATKRIKLSTTQRRTIERKRLAYAERGKTRAADRCRAVELCADGWELHEIAAAVKRPYPTVQRWLRLFRQAGVRTLDVKPRSGRPRELDDHERLLLDKAIQRGSRAAGYAGGVWTSPLVADYIKQRFGIEYHPGHVRKILHHLGFSVQYPRERLALADRKKQERWLKRTFPRIKKGRAKTAP